MATGKLLYASPATITISLASLATSATFVAGVESTQIDNTSNLYIDAIVQGKVTVGTTPTANTLITVYVWGSDTSLGTTALDVLDGTDSAETITSVGVLQSMFAIGGQGIVDATTSDRPYFIRNFSVARALNLMFLPRYWGLFVAHNTAVNLNSTGSNHVFSYTGVQYTIA